MMSDAKQIVPRNALFVCFGCMSNVGALTGLAGLEVVRSSDRERAGIFCLGGLATGAQTVLEKTRQAQHIITVDGCPLNCARKIVEQAGFIPERIINLVQDCGIAKQPGIAYSEEEFQRAVAAIEAALQ